MYELAKEDLSRIEDAWGRAKENVGRQTGLVQELQRKETEVATIPESDLEALSSQHHHLSRDLVRVEEEAERVSREVASAREGIRRMRAGLPLYPSHVAAAFQGLDAAGIPYRILAATVELQKPDNAEEVEAALGDARPTFRT